MRSATPREERYNIFFYLLEAPRIYLSPGGKYFIEGSPVTVACTASGKPPPDVAWIRNGVLESSGKKVASLKFNNINREDAGQYTCRANNSMKVTSIDTRIVVNCKFILTLISISKFTLFTVQLLLMRFRYTKLTNLFKSVRKQNFTSNPFRLCMRWSQVLVGTTEFRWNHCLHYFASKDVTIVFLHQYLFVTQKMAKSHFRVIVTAQFRLTSAQGWRIFRFCVNTFGWA